MVETRRPLGKLSFHPLTLDRWADLENLFGPRGACAGCWCMWWRQSRADFVKNQGEANKRALQSLVRKGEIPGILAYDGDEPVGWCALAPRESYPTIARSPTLKPIDDVPAWSITCFFVRRGYRRAGMTGRLIKAALDRARQEGARLVEAYPVIPKSENVPALYAYTGFHTTFLKAGFAEVARRSPNRPILRKKLGRARAARS
jgi:GNAT superfamily N-acetyltransferase